MTAQRIKGQEVSVVFVGPTGTEDTFGAVQSFEATTQMEILTEGYLGETSNRRDDIFNGLTGSVDIHLQTNEYAAFWRRVKDRAQRRSPAAGQFNATGVFNFPNGQKMRFQLIDIFFGEMPMNAGARGEYVSVSVPFECQDGFLLPS